MPHVIRSPLGDIVSLHREPVVGSEWVDPQSVELHHFVGMEDASGSGDFRQLDADLVRVIEDLIDVLISRQVIRVTDLPAQAQEKLFARKSFRDRLPSRALRLFESDAGPESGVISTDFGAL